MSDFDKLYKNEAFMPYFKAEYTYTRSVEGEANIEFEIEGMDSTISSDLQLEFGAKIVEESREFMFRVSDLHKENVQHPEKNDHIEDKKGNIWAVASIGAAPEWEYDAERTWFRIRTVLDTDGYAPTSLL